MLELKSENKVLFGAVLVLIILSSFLLFGVTGLRTLLGLLIFAFFPFYLVFDNFDLSQGEKAVFSFFVSITLFPSFVYWLGFVVSFRAAILIIFAALLLTGYLIKKINKKYSKSHKYLSIKL